jgi:two-component sensor histidine kinase/predicted hydrocarbon binding protein
MNLEIEIQNLKKRIHELEQENSNLKKSKKVFFTTGKTVKTPKAFETIFAEANKTVKKYFETFAANPSLSKIEVNGQRYVLMRAESLANNFFENILNLYSDRPTDEAVKIGRNLLFDFAHLIGIEDAKNFHKTMNLTDPIAKLSAGPVHFAYTGWAFVDILSESKPSADENFYLKYNHPYSFEADSWIKSNKKSDFPVCSMNAGYSSGWCEQSFGIELTAVEITCRAKGDKHCTFIMAPPNQIGKYLTKEERKLKLKVKYDVPLFFERKKTEEKIRNTLKEKETLLREIHHRVKNNLQVISSLLKLHADNSSDINFLKLVEESQNRIISMSLIHEMLYANSDLSNINFVAYTNSLFKKLQSTYNCNLVTLKTHIPDDFCFEVDRLIPIGLILNEIFSNSFKYAFGNKSGIVTVALSETMLTVSDNGKGLKQNIMAKGDSGFGLQLINLLADQIDAYLTIKTEKGASFEFKFKKVE